MHAWYHTYIAQSFLSSHNLKIKHSTKQNQIQNKINKQAIMGVLTVKVIKATNLADKDFVGKTDPYVQIELEQDNMIRDKDYGMQKTSTKKGERNPVWDEEFTFNIPTLNNMELSLKVYDDDVGSRDDKCGKCKIKLEKEGITRSPKRIERTIDRNLLRKNGKLVVEISYSE